MATFCFCEIGGNMIQIEYVIENASGLHARPASMLVREATSYQSDISLVKNDKKINCKSIMSVLSAGVKQGDAVTFVFDGADEDVASVKFKDFLRQEFKTI